MPGPQDRIVRVKGKTDLPTALELEVAEALDNLEKNASSDTMKADIGMLKITCVREYAVVATDGDKKKDVLVVGIPKGLFMHFAKKNQSRLIHELEKRTKKFVVLYAHRFVVPVHYKKYGYTQRPKSGTLTAVHSCLLEDIVGPTEIVGKHVRHAVQGTSTLVVRLDSRDKSKDNLEEKLDAFATAYNALTKKEVVFEFDC